MEIDLLKNYPKSKRDTKGRSETKSFRRSTQGEYTQLNMYHHLEFFFFVVLPCGYCTQCGYCSATSAIGTYQEDVVHVCNLFFTNNIYIYLVPFNVVQRYTYV